MRRMLACIALVLPHVLPAQPRRDVRPNSGAPTRVLPRPVEAAIDSLFRQAYPSRAPGATVLIARGDTVLYRKAFGMADLELQVPMQPDHVLQLASITKQFTSVAILMLMEQGKLSLQDPLSKFVPDFPRGNEITIHHLLNHSSGIMSYTNVAEFRAKMRLDMTPEEIIGSMKGIPLEFAPGTQYNYSNTGYVLLGHIIEKLSGMSYATFIRTRIFDTLGMTQSYYGSNDAVIPRRARGYQLNDDVFEHPEYFSPTIAYAAGGLLSTVDDMMRWTMALRRNRLISERSLRMAFTNHPLSNGRPSNYGYGWFINELADVPTAEHPGGINGYATSGVFLPSTGMYAIVLTNHDDGNGPELLTLKSLLLLMGKPIGAERPANLTEAQLRQWVGAYQFDDVVRFITFDKGSLYSTREGGRPLRLIPVTERQFRFDGRLSTFEFSVQDGKRQALYADRGRKGTGRETNRTPPAERQAIAVPPTVLASYVGVYQLQPGMQIDVRLENGHLMATAMGNPPVELLAEAEDRFFIREIGAQVMFVRGPDGVVQRLVFSQGGRAMDGEKIR
jgi:CubicO group peptidase (beta-lactamase class C family)